MIGLTKMEINQKTMCEMVEHYLRNKTFFGNLTVTDVHALNSHKKGSKDKFVITFLTIKETENNAPK